MARPRAAAAGAARARLVVQFPRLGPYHAARLAAALRRGHVEALESSVGEDEYAWASAEGDTGFARHSLPAGAPGKAARVEETLGRLRPDVVALCGWSDPAALAGLRWCLRTGVPAVLMSDSLKPARPSWATQALKRRLVGLFGAGLVGGAAHAHYLAELGMPRERIFTGYDVVDNQHFARGADAARESDGSARAGRGLPARYFFACQRLIPEKNPLGLLAAFARYRTQAGSTAWDLVIAGDGPLREEVMRAAAEPPLAGHVRLLGRVGYRELPGLYGLAGGFVLASVSDTWGLATNEAMAAGLPVVVSRACGCFAELIRDGENGFGFDPRDEAELARVLLWLGGQGEEVRRRLGRAARETIERWSPDVFADALWAAAAAAGGNGRADRLGAGLAWALSRR
jgi:glycosyltransferase involved in cell wall biosynthesis